jgi:hypothetical protein
VARSRRRSAAALTDWVVAIWRDTSRNAATSAWRKFARRMSVTQHLVPWRADAPWHVVEGDGHRSIEIQIRGENESEFATRNGDQQTPGRLGLQENFCRLYLLDSEASRAPSICSSSLPGH